MLNCGYSPRSPSNNLNKFPVSSPPFPSPKQKTPPLFTRNGVLVFSSWSPLRLGLMCYRMIVRDAITRCDLGQGCWEVSASGKVNSVKREKLQLELLNPIPPTHTVSGQALNLCIYLSSKLSTLPRFQSEETWEPCCSPPCSFHE